MCSYSSTSTNNSKSKLLQNNNDTNENKENNNKKRKNKLSGIEHKFLGLSPTFWSNVPLLINDIISLGHKNGIDCIVVTTNDENRNNDSNIIASSRNEELSNQQSERRQHSGNKLDDGSINNNPIISKEESNDDYLLPITRCEVVGIVVNIEIRGDNFTIYTIDDGTGLIDCSYYCDHSTLFDSLSNDNASSENNACGNNNNVIRLGDTVRIFGKVQCLASESTLESNNKVKYTREIYVNNIYPIRQEYKNNVNEDNCNAESIHYLRSIKFMKNVQRKKKKRKRKNNNSKKDEKIIFNAPEVLNSLGSEESSISSLLLSHHENNNNNSDNNNFDIQINTFTNFNCPCNNVSYKPDLLYCHCIAKSESLDPYFTFRDALLQTLLQQQKIQQQQNDKDCDDSINNTLTPYHFYYKSCIQDKNLINIAEKTILKMMQTTSSLSSSSNQNHPTNTALAVNIRRIFLNTFHALREDGIIYLMNQNKDEYCLICSNYVLKPWILQNVPNDATTTTTTNRRYNSHKTRDFMELLRHRPSYLQHVPIGRFMALSQLIEN